MFWNCTRRPLGEDFARGWLDEANDGDDHDPLVLFESPDGAEAHAVWKLLTRNGYRMTWCPGPQGGFSSECALAAGHCPLVDEADAVVSALDLREPVCGKVVRALDAQTGETPVVVVAPRRSVAHWAEEAPDCQVVAGPLSSKVLIRALSVARATATATAAVS